MLKDTTSRGLCVRVRPPHWYSFSNHYTKSTNGKETRAVAAVGPELREARATLLESESRLVSHGQSRPCPLVSHYKFYNGPDRTLGSRPTHIRLYAPADRRRIDMRPNPI